MIDLMSGIFDMTFGAVEMAFGLVGGVFDFVFGLLGGIVSFFFWLLGIGLALLLLVIFVRRRSRKGGANDGSVLVDENGETFTSFYHQNDE